MVAWTLVIHTFGLVFWVSGLLVTAIVLWRHTQETSSDVRAVLARLERTFLRGMADPGALLTVLAGIALVASNRSYYLHARWLHMKLVFVVTLIGLHGVVAMRSKSYAAGRIQLRPSQVTTMLAIIVIVFLLILISTLPGEVYLT